MWQGLATRRTRGSRGSGATGPGMCQGGTRPNSTERAALGPRTEDGMNSLRNLFMAIPLLSLVGCGCVSDEGGGGGQPSAIRTFLVGTRVNPIPVQPQAAKIRIDVFFLMDDSGFNPNGVPANQPGFVYGDVSYFPTQPGRKKQQ